MLALDDARHRKPNVARESVPAFCNNQLVARLSGACRAAILRHAEPTPLETRQMLQERNVQLQNVYLIESGMASMVAKADEGRSTVEVQTLGVHDFVGLPLLHGVEASPHRCIVRAAGMALRIDARTFREILLAQPEFQKLLLRYSHEVAVHASQLIACNTKHNLRQRLARWLLVASSRLGADRIDITHDGLSRAIAVRRAGVTTEMGRMEQVGLIRRSRGAILIENRKGLEATSCACHRLLRAGSSNLISSTQAQSRCDALRTVETSQVKRRSSLLIEPPQLHS
ncbi:Crp/Fnr family transcriptional regulator [Tardiphaga alba]|uniref:Crp/Fnr family transcriptional regulator n=1 Tax=Tardiphaga alba TaxID=340268 RepID=A0ABX8ACJ2_9BRAD|nr:Crp/Fnr family transcriptional regulator [Tardiphaga alba]QUS40691.1 Crp/Fnr family transcriptional regulator [Tardiphaga alba]